MPHVVIKMMPGRPDELKQKLADEIVATVMRTIGVGEETLSVAIEDVARSDWNEKVFEPEIRGKKELLFRKPGYKAV